MSQEWRSVGLRLSCSSLIEGLAVLSKQNRGYLSFYSNGADAMRAVGVALKADQAQTLAAAFAQGLFKQ